MLWNCSSTEANSGTKSCLMACMPLLSLKCLLWTGTTVAICMWLEMSLYSFTPEVPESGMIIWAGLMESSLVRVLG